MKQERVKYLLEALEGFVKEVARDYADGLDEDEKCKIQDWYIEEAIRIALDIPSMRDLPDFFGYIAEEVMDEVARIMAERGHDVEWYAGDLIIYPLPAQEE